MEFNMKPDGYTLNKDGREMKIATDASFTSEFQKVQLANRLTQLSRADTFGGSKN
jgi:hypothetical protein